MECTQTCVKHGSKIIAANLCFLCVGLIWANGVLDPFRLLIVYLTHLWGLHSVLIRLLPFFLLWHLFVFVFVIAVTAIAAMASSDNDTACNSGDSASGDSDGCDGDGVVLCCSDSGSLGLVVGAAAGAFFYHSWYVGHSHSLIVILNHTVRITMMTLYFLFSDNDNMS